MNTKKIDFVITEKRIKKIHGGTKELLFQKHRNKRLFAQSRLRHFYGVAISSLPPWLLRADMPNHCTAGWMATESRNTISFLTQDSKTWRTELT